MPDSAEAIWPMASPAPPPPEPPVSTLTVLLPPVAVALPPVPVAVDPPPLEFLPPLGLLPPFGLLPPLPPLRSPPAPACLHAMPQPDAGTAEGVPVCDTNSLVVWCTLPVCG